MEEANEWGVTGLPADQVEEALARHERASQKLQERLDRLGTLILWRVRPLERARLQAEGLGPERALWLLDYIPITCALSIGGRLLSLSYSMSVDVVEDDEALARMLSVMKRQVAEGLVEVILHPEQVEGWRQPKGKRPGRNGASRKAAEA